MDTSLSNDELAVLTEVVREYLSDLRTEIHVTDSYDFKQDLKKKEHLLREVLTKLDQVRLALAE